MQGGEVDIQAVQGGGGEFGQAGEHRAGAAADRLAGARSYSSHSAGLLALVAFVPVAVVVDGLVQGIGGQVATVHLLRRQAPEGFGHRTVR